MAERYLRLFPDDPQKRRVFPNPIQFEPHIEWMLRYAPDCMSREDHIYAASIIHAYAYLICDMPARDRQSVVSEIRRKIGL